MQLSETQNKLLAILFAAGEPLEGARAAEALGWTEEPLAERIAACLAKNGLPTKRPSPPRI